MPVVLFPLFRRRRGHSEGRGTGRTGGPALPATPNTARPRTANALPSWNNTNPRAGPVVPTTSLQNNFAPRIVDQATLLKNSPIGPGRAYQMSPADDISNANMQIQLVYTSNPTTVSGSIQVTTAIQNVYILNPGGTIIQFYPGYILHAQYTRFNAVTTDFVDASTAVVVSGATLPTVTVQFPFISLPRPANPALGGYQVQFQYASFASIGVWATNNGPKITAATGLLSASITVTWTPAIGEATNGEGRVMVGQLTGLAAGVNDEAQNMNVKNADVVDVLMQGFAADTDLDHITLQTNGGANLPFWTESDAVAAYTQKIQASRPTGQFWLLQSSQIAFNAATLFQIWLATGATTTSITVATFRYANPGEP